MHFENRLATLEIGQLHLDPTVEAPGAQQCLVEALGTVRSGQDHHTLAAVKPVHLGQQLVERLFALVVAADGRIPALADGVDLVDEDDAGSLLACLTEEVTHLGRTHTDEHLHELRARNGEKRHPGLARNGSRDERLARTRRADQQGSLGQRGPDLGISGGIVQEIDDLAQGLLSLVLTGHIGKRGLHVGIGIDLRPAAAERHEVAALAHAGLDASAGLTPDQVEGQSGQHPHEKEVEQRRVLARNDPVERDSPVGIRAFGLQQPIDQSGVVDRTGTVGLRAVAGSRRGEVDLSVLDDYVADQAAVHLGDEGAVVGLDDPSARETREDQPVEQQDDQQAPQYARKRAALRGGLVLRIRTLHGNIAHFRRKNRKIHRYAPYPIVRKNVQFFPQRPITGALRQKVPASGVSAPAGWRSGAEDAHGMGARVHNP